MGFLLKPIGDSTNHLVDTPADPEYPQAIEKIVQPGGITHEHRPSDNKSNADQYNARYNIAEPFDALLGRFLFGGSGPRLGLGNIIDICGI